MFMRTRASGPLVVFGFLSAASLLAQDIPLPGGSIKVKFPADSPVLFSGLATDQSRATARGAAMSLDLHMALLLRNVGPRPIHGVTLRVVAQEVTLGGKGSVAYPSLRIAQGETFPVRIDMQLMRPTQAMNGALVEVNLDGVLFEDLTFYGPDRLNSRRTMTAWEMEAQRDRQYFKRILAQAGPEGLRAAVTDSLAQQAARPRLDVRVVRGGPAVTAAAMAPSERTAEFAFLQVPGEPVSPTSGTAKLSGNEARGPSVEVVNNSGRPVKHVELNWLVRDQAGQQYMAGSLPASGPDWALAPGQRGRLMQDTTMQFSRNGQPVPVSKMLGFVSMVEFADGKEWVPDRAALERLQLSKVLAPSAEEQRLTDLYRKRGLNALMDELKKY
jgi:hypothetical protein